MNIAQKRVLVVGAGLAGCEAAWQLAKRGIPVTLYEMRPLVSTKAHKTDLCAELVCSNSLGSNDSHTAKGVLKEELRSLDSLIVRSADDTRLPAGGALAVDRTLFSEAITRAIKSHPLIEYRTEEVQKLPAASPERPVIIASGPLTSAALSHEIAALNGENQLSFFDAISPVVTVQSINFERAFKQSRYDKGGGDDYINLPLTREEYYAFVDDILNAEYFGGHQEVETENLEGIRPFEGCMPVEEIARRGRESLRFGPFKPIGLTDPKTGKRPFAAVQLRQDNQEATLFALVAMQTRMKHHEQLRIFRKLPGLEEAEFVRLGSVHRNTFINSPACLNATLESRKQPGLFFAGQITGVEGYAESIAAGAIAGINAARMVAGKDPAVIPTITAIGALLAYITAPDRKDFQPMNMSFGLMPAYTNVLAAGHVKKASKIELRAQIAESAVSGMKSFIQSL